VIEPSRTKVTVIFILHPETRGLRCWNYVWTQLIGIKRGGAREPKIRKTRVEVLALHTLAAQTFDGVICRSCLDHHLRYEFATRFATVDAEFASLFDEPIIANGSTNAALNDGSRSFQSFWLTKTCDTRKDCYNALTDPTPSSHLVPHRGKIFSKLLEVGHICWQGKLG